MSKPVFQERVNFDGQIDPKGRIFVCPKTGTITDLSGVKILHCGVDTVRQLYRGRIQAGVLDLFQVPGIVRFAGYMWHAGRVGRDSGYQFKLQNSDLGLILLIKNFNVADNDHGPHLKIEVSPHLLMATAPDDLQRMMDTLASNVLSEAEPNQCAVHIALDVQGWTPPADTVARMHCRSRKVRDISGIDSVEWHGKSSVYGRGETYMFGSANSLQLAIYNKTLQARTTDKLDFWQQVWRKTDNPFDAADPTNYDPGQDVYRLEPRFHHSVIQQFAMGSYDTGTAEVIATRTFAELVPHLKALFQYAMDQFKLLSSPGVFCAAWRLFRDDAQVTGGADYLAGAVEYRRAYKTAGGFTGKNVDLFMGNLISLAARERLGSKKVFDQLKESALWSVVLEHFENKGKGERDVYRWIRDKLTERTIRYGVAV